MAEKEARMRPRVFISSTFYDLKYIREDVGDFVKAYGFEPILFENGDIGYTPGRPLDESCYQSISKSDMVILMIGGLYGSPASSEAGDEFKEYMSVTRKEFEAARDEGIPIYAFIDASVYSEYQVYEKNYDDIENNKREVKFHATKNINVFRFIESLQKHKNIVINAFQRTSDIKNYLSGQWSGWVSEYLQLMRKRDRETSVENSLLTLKQNVEKINLLVDEIGKSFLNSKDSGVYAEVKEKQIVSDIKNIISDAFDFWVYMKTEEEFVEFVKRFVSVLSTMLKNRRFHLYMSDDYEEVENFYREFRFDSVEIVEIKEGVEIELEPFVEKMQQKEVQERLVDELLKTKDFRFYKK